MHQNRFVWCAIVLSVSITASMSLPPPPPMPTTTLSSSSLGTTTKTTSTRYNGPFLDFLPGGTSSPLQEKQCDIGTRIDDANPSEYAETNLLYIDTDRPATCSGSVAAWELCYRTSGLDLSSTFNLLLLSKVMDGYDIRATYTITVEEADFEQRTDFVSCTYIQAMETVLISQGDYTGFICKNDIRIGFSPIQENVLSTLHVFNLSSIASTEQQVLDINNVPTDKLQRMRSNVVDQFRIIINKTVPTSTPCESGTTTIWTPVFTAVVIASVVVIFVLFIMVCLMGCCICQFKFKCCKLFTRCCKKKRVTHRITVEPITDQSMQYNDLYVPCDPSQVITDGEQHRVNFRGNPAYDTPQSKKYSAMIKAVPSQDALSTATELSTLEHYDSPKAASDKPQRNSLPFASPSVTSNMDLDMHDSFEESREFDHTYEMIQSGKIVK